MERVRERSIIIDGHVDVVSLNRCYGAVTLGRSGMTGEFSKRCHRYEGRLAAVLAAPEGLKELGFVPKGQIHFIMPLTRDKRRIVRRQTG
jgi:hypothetical protein